MGKILQFEKQNYEKKDSENNVLEIDHEKGVVSSLDKSNILEESFEDRVTRIRKSLEKINSLMAALKNKENDKGDK